MTDSWRHPLPNVKTLLRVPPRGGFHRLQSGFVVIIIDGRCQLHRSMLATHHAVNETFVLGPVVAEMTGNHGAIKPLTLGNASVEIGSRCCNDANAVIGDRQPNAALGQPLGEVSMVDWVYA